MSSIKTIVSDTPIKEYVAKLSDAQKQSDAKVLLAIFDRATGINPKMWGDSMVGYGSYHYKSERSRQAGDWPLIGFSIRKSSISIYIMPGFSEYRDLLDQLGKHKTSVGCLYIPKLSQIDLNILSELIKRVIKDMKSLHPNAKN